jgi:hypothetical protein
MKCQEAQESMLESLVEPLAVERRLALEEHITGCETCTHFFEIHHLLDIRLAAALPPSQLSSSFRASLKEKIHRDPVSAWPDFLPDLAHLGGCAVANLLLLLLLPWRSDTVLLAGTAFACVTFFLQAVIRSSLNGLERDA